MFIPTREYFPAVLKTAEGNFLAEGHAKGDLAARTLEFRSEFVPLLKYRTQAKIARIEKGYETQNCEGTVYLSSPALLRLVNVNERELAQVELEALQEVHFIGTAIRRESSREIGSPAEIYSISYNRLRFTSNEEFEEGEQVGFVLDKPYPLRGIELRIQEKIAFGQEERSGYRCEILYQPPEGRELLTDYIIQQAHEKEEG